MLIADWEELEKHSTSEVHVKRFESRDAQIDTMQRKVRILICRRIDQTRFLQQEDQNAEGVSDGKRHPQLARAGGGSLAGVSFPATPQAADRMAIEEKDDFISIQATSIYRRHVAPCCPTYVPSEASLPIRLRLMRQARTNLGNSIIDDYWNVDGSKTVSEVWPGFTVLKFHRHVHREVTSGHLEGQPKFHQSTKQDSIWPEF